MKKALIRLLSLAVAVSLCGCAALAEELQNYTLTEKLTQQALKSGLAASAVLTVEGEGELINQLKPFSGVQLQLRAYPTDEKAAKKYDFHYRLFTGTSDAPQNQTELWSTGKTMYMQSELLMNVLYSLPVRGDVLTTLLSADSGNNPSFWTALPALLSVPEETWQDKWEPELAALRQQVEFWLNTQQAEQAIENSADGARMRIRYEISADALRAELKALLRTALASENLTGLVQGLMRGEQQQVYFSSGYLWYYDRLIDSLPLTESVTLERVTSLLGEQLNASAVLPLAGSPYGVDVVTLTEEGDQLQVELNGGDFTLVWARNANIAEANGFTRRGVIRYIPAGGMAFSAAYQLRVLTSAEVDASGNEVETTNAELRLTQDLSHLAANDPTLSQYLVFEPVQVRVRAQLSSKQNDSSAMTRYDVQAAAALEEGTIGLRLRAESFALEDTSDLSTAGATDLSRRSAAERQEILSDLLVSAALTLGVYPVATPADIPTPAEEEPATPADLPALTPVSTEPAAPETKPDDIPGTPATEDPAEADEAAAEPTATPTAAPTATPEPEATATHGGGLVNLGTAWH